MPSVIYYNWIYCFNSVVLRVLTIVKTNKSLDLAKAIDK